MTVFRQTILQGSVATRLRCGGIVKRSHHTLNVLLIVSNCLTTNFLQNPSVKEFRKSVKTRQSYHEKFDAHFFMGHSVYTLYCTVL